MVVLQSDQHHPSTLSTGKKSGIGPVVDRNARTLYRQSTHEIFHEEESDGEDEEVATLTGTDRNKTSSSKILNTPFASSKTLATQVVHSSNQNHIISATHAGLEDNRHRRTPGAPLMRNSAFITPHKIFPKGIADTDMKSQAAATNELQNKQNQGTANNKEQTGPKGARSLRSAVNHSDNPMGFGLVSSPGRPPPLPVSNKSKYSAGRGKGKVQGIPTTGTPNYREMSMIEAASRTGVTDPVGRKTVYTPTDITLAKNSDIFLRRTGTGAYSPYTAQLISGIDGVLTDDDTSTPQSVISKDSQQDMTRSSSKEEGAAFPNETWYTKFTETSSRRQFPKDSDKMNDIAHGTVGSSKAEGILHFDVMPQVGSCFQPAISNSNQFQPNHSEVPESSSNDPCSSENSGPLITTHNVHQQHAAPVPLEFVGSNIMDQGKDENAYQYPRQYMNQGSLDHRHLPHQGYLGRPFTETNVHQRSLQLSGMDNHHMIFPQQPINGHMSPHLFGHLSPLNVPNCSSPQTIPTYEYPMAPIQVAHPSVSPIPFDHLAWHGQDIHRHQNQNWNGSGDVGLWHHPHQRQSMPVPDFINNRHLVPSPPSHPSPSIHSHQYHSQFHWENQEFNHFKSGSIPSHRHEIASLHAHAMDQKQRFVGTESTYTNTNAVASRGSEQDSFVAEKLKESLKVRERKHNKQVKALSDSSTKRMNQNNEDQAINDCIDKSRGGGKKHDRRYSGEEMVELKELTMVEQEAEERRAELVESPAIRNLLKEFYRKFRSKEKESLEMAADFAKSCLSQSDFPKSLHWRIILEMADLKKRSNLFDEARELYCDVCRLQPYANQGWLERSKLEEESGRLPECSSILHEGLKYCPMNESLRTRAIKHEERMAYEHGDGNLNQARYLLAPLKHFSIEKVWKTVLEGALMEARAGNEIVARQILKYLMKWVSWYGPLYLEAFRLERDYGYVDSALSVVDNGLKEIPRYGPLWFGAFRICEGMDIENGHLHLPKTFDYINRAIKSISRELIWKVQMEAAQALERAAHTAKNGNSSISLNTMLTESRHRFVRTIFSCPENLCWKVWLAAGRMELSAGRFEEAKRLFLKSYSVVPAKGRPAVLLECVRLEEFVGNTKLAKAILCKSRNEAKADWKVWLQSVSIEVRSGNRKLAINLAQKGLLQHPGTGRLWATLVQVREKDGEKQQMKALKKALHAVPKSGEVWCEAARIFLNPFSPCFDLLVSSQYLDFATKFTPQYGDSFLEKLREEMISLLIRRFTPYVEKSISVLKDCSDEELPRKILRIIQNAASDLDNNAVVTKGIKEMAENLDTLKLELRCSNADPNYGKLWFHSRSKPSDTARKVLKQAKEIIWNDLRHYGFMYIVATIRQQAVKYCKEANKQVCVPSLTELLSVKWQDINLLEGISKADFVTGFIEANREVDLQTLSLFDRRKILFGSDLLLI